MEQYLIQILIDVDVLGPSTLCDPVAQNEEKWQNQFCHMNSKGFEPAERR